MEFIDSMRSQRIAPSIGTDANGLRKCLIGLYKTFEHAHYAALIPQDSTG